MGTTLARVASATLLIALCIAGVIHLGADGRAFACGAAGPYDFDTYEPEQYQATFAKAIEIATAGRAVTFTPRVSSTGENVDLRYQGLARGPRTQRTTVLNPAIRIPPTLFKSIAWIESDWANGGTSVPYGGVGPGLRSFDCGYGISQVTSGMENATGSATGKQALVASHFLFNIAEGVRILAEKWNSAPRFRPVAGTGDPAAIEDWYYATWGYNGFVFSNHPLNPNLDALRGELYHCEDPAAPNYTGFLRGDFTYTEKVYGCMRFPPIRDGRRLWPAVTFEMPKLTDERVAPAFDPAVYDACDERNWSDGCPAMDFPTTLPPLNNQPPPGGTPTPTPTQGAQPTVTPTPGGTATPTQGGVPTAGVVTPTPGATTSPTPGGTATPTPGGVPTAGVVTHTDPTPLLAPNVIATDLATILGDPRLVYNGPTQVTLGAGASSSATISITNAGRGVAPFLIRASAPWIVVHHPGDPVSRTMDGGVAVGLETQVVTVAPNATRARVAQAGYTSNLVIELDTSKMPPGQSVGKIWIDPLLGIGPSVEITVTGNRAGVAFKNRIFAPNIAGG